MFRTGSRNLVAEHRPEAKNKSFFRAWKQSRDADGADTALLNGLKKPKREDSVEQFEFTEPAPKPAQNTSRFAQSSVAVLS
jgi:hypothetical protein